jgi:hypothetical protein
MKTFSLLILSLLLLSGCANREDPEVLKPFLEEQVKKFITDETGQVSINNFQVTGSKDNETAIDGTPASVTATAFTCGFRLEEDTYWTCDTAGTFSADKLNGKGLAELLCFRKVKYGSSNWDRPPLVAKGTILHAEGEIMFIDFERKSRPSYVEIKVKFVSGK